MNVAALMADRGELGEQPAIITRGGRARTWLDVLRRRRDPAISFADLADAAARRAGVLRGFGVGEGSAVLLLVPVSVELYVSLIAVLHAGATAMFLDPSAGRGHVRDCCDVRTPDVVIGAGKALPLRWLGGPLREAVPTWLHLGGLAWPGVTPMPDGQPVPVADRDDDDPAVLTFTSGSTGKPKAAVRSHGVLRAQGEAVAAEFDLRAGEADLTTLPMFVLANLAAGVASVLPDVDLGRPGVADGATLARAVTRHGCTTTAGSPALLKRLAAHGASLPTLRGVFTGGAPVMPSLLDAVAAVPPGADVTAVYGSTEAEPIAAAPRSMLTDADRQTTRTGGGLLAGVPADVAEVRVIRDRTGTDLPSLLSEELDALTLPPNEPGEIVVSGPHVLPGYLNGVGDAATKIHVGGHVWHRTGDAGRFDDVGRLWLLGRCVARVGDVYPLQVEAALDGVVDRAALVEREGQRLLLVEPSAAVDAARAAIGDRVDEVRGIPAIPLDKRNNAKVDYPALRAMLDRETSLH